MSPTPSSLVMSSSGDSRVNPKCPVSPGLLPPSLFSFNRALMARISRSSSATLVSVRLRCLRFCRGVKTHGRPERAHLWHTSGFDSSGRQRTFCDRQWAHARCDGTSIGLLTGFTLARAAQRDDIRCESEKRNKLLPVGPYTRASFRERLGLLSRRLTALHSAAYRRASARIGPSRILRSTTYQRCC